MTGIEINFSPSKKQAEAWGYLTDNITSYIGYGGAAYGGKSWLLCYFYTAMSISYPDTGWGIGRKELTTLKKTTLITLFKVFKECNIKDGRDYNYNKQLNIITFYNKSQIFLLDTAMKPSDPLFTRFGGLELTGAGIDESAESPYEGIEILFTRIGRRNNEKYGILAKLLETFNPAKNHVYTRYYSPWSRHELQPHVKFVKALPADNPSPGVDKYISGIIAAGKKITIERLIHGNFDYDDDPTVLCDYDAICDLFANEHVKPTGKKRIAADLAMQGRDKFIAGSGNGLVIKIAIDQPKSTGKSIQTDLQNLMTTTGTSRSNTVVDSDGLGNYLESYLEGIKEFHGNGKPFENVKNKEDLKFGVYREPEYANLKAQCAYKLAEKINNREMKIICSPEQKQRIIEEIAILKSESIDKDESKKRIIKKELMKELLGRSPDYLDMLIMYMYFEVMPINKVWMI